MKPPSLRKIGAIFVLLGTIGFFVYYFAKHPAVQERLRATPPGILLLILFLYFVSIVALALITIATLRLCEIPLSRGESIRLTAYSTLINFFGPLQSGPAFRAIYLKKKHGASLKKYASATLIYYLVYGIISLLFLASYWLGWQFGVIVIAGLMCLYLLLKSRFFSDKLKIINLKDWYFLAFATAFQLAIIATIYYIELRTIAPHTTLHQAIIYSGAANLALFVSLTPGAIGFRESFLVFSHRLHHISSSTIITANILDRSLYIILLVILAIGIFATHTNDSLKAGINKKKPNQTPDDK